MNVRPEAQDANSGRGKGRGAGGSAGWVLRGEDRDWGAVGGGNGGCRRERRKERGGTFDLGRAQVPHSLVVRFPDLSFLGAGERDRVSGGHGQAPMLLLLLLLLLIGGWRDRHRHGDGGLECYRPTVLCAGEQSQSETRPIVR